LHVEFFSQNNMPAFISSCCIHPVEQMASSYSVIRLRDQFMRQTKDILVLPIISRHFAATIPVSASLSSTF